MKLRLIRFLKVFFSFLILISLVYYLGIRPIITSPIDEPAYIRSYSIKSEDLQKHVAFLTNLTPFRNVEHPESLNAAADYIEKEWTSIGLHVEQQKYLLNGKEYKNLIVRFGPATPNIIIVGAHYDVCLEQSGADDNASGVSGLIELARLLQKYQGKFIKQIQLVAFTLEEPPTYRTEYMGSFIHAKSIHDRNLNVDLMISLEMIGYFSEEKNTQNFPIELLKLHYPTIGNFIALVSNIENRQLVKEVKTDMKKYSLVPVFSINGPNMIPGIDYSDHRSYWKFGFENAMMLTDTSFYRNHNYHLPSDTADTLNYVKMSEVISGVFGMLIQMTK